jgi:hypothetical protein
MAAAGPQKGMEESCAPVGCSSIFALIRRADLRRVERRRRNSPGSFAPRQSRFCRPKTRVSLCRMDNGVFLEIA